MGQRRQRLDHHQNPLRRHNPRSRLPLQEEGICFARDLVDYRCACISKHWNCDSGINTIMRIQSSAYEEVLEILEFLEVHLPRKVDGKAAIIEMKNGGSRNWRGLIRS